MNILTEMIHREVAEDFLESIELMAELQVDAALRQRGIAACRAKEAGIHDYHEGIHAPPPIFRPFPVLLDNWLLGNASEAIAAACHELLASRRRRDNETMAGVREKVRSLRIHH